MLLIALLVLVSLAGVGMTAAYIVNDEMSFAGANRRGSTAFRVTEAGAFAALSHLSGLGAAALANMVASGQDDSGKLIWTEEDLVPTMPFFDSSEYGSFGYEGAVLAAEGQKPATFEIWITEVGMRQPLSGYGFSGPDSLCRVKYQLDAVGSMGSEISDGPADASTKVWQKIRTVLYVGPLPCSQSSAALGGL
jgi:hypothetical protein